MSAEDDREPAEEPADDGSSRGRVGVSGLPLSYAFANGRKASEAMRQMVREPHSKPRRATLDELEGDDG